MKAYPLIYSRTKNIDFVPDFLVRPKDLDVVAALRYVSSAMFDVDALDGVRYSSFTVGNYIICGGIACMSKNLYALLQKINPRITAKYAADTVSDYLSDCKGRRVACYIGLAVPKSEVKPGIIPELTLEDYWSVYFEYLQHQWYSEEDTTSEKLEGLPPLTLNEKRYTSSYVPAAKQVNGRSVIRQEEFLAHQQEILDYAFYQLLSGKDYSLITEVNRLNHWTQTTYNATVVPEEIYDSVQSVSASEMHASKSLLHQVDTQNSKGGSQIARNEFLDKSSDIPMQKKKAGPSDSPHGSSTPNKHSSLPVMIIAAAVVLLVLILLIK